MSGVVAPATPCSVGSGDAAVTMIGMSPASTLRMTRSSSSTDIDALTVFAHLAAALYCRAIEAPDRTAAGDPQALNPMILPA